MSDKQADSHTVLAEKGMTCQQQHAAHVAALASQVPAQTPAPPEVGWLIENTDSEWAYVTLKPTRSFRWTRDSVKALRFSRREDAESVMVFMQGWENLKVTEHLWDNGGDLVPAQGTPPVLPYEGATGHLEEHVPAPASPPPAQDEAGQAERDFWTAAKGRLSELQQLREQESCNWDNETDRYIESRIAKLTDIVCGTFVADIAMPAPASPQVGETLEFRKPGEIVVNTPGCDKCGKIFLDCQCASLYEEIIRLLLRNANREAQANDIANFIRTKLRAALAESDTWRRLLWLNHARYIPGVHMPYGDDGEMQCCGIDFKRQSAAEIDEFLTRRARAAQPTPAPKERTGE
jgi:hypothetical protein